MVSDLKYEKAQINKAEEKRATNLRLKNKSLETLG